MKREKKIKPIYTMSILSSHLSDMLTAEKLDVLKSHKVVTSLDFLQYNNDKLTVLMGATVSDVIKIKEKILELNSIQSMRADKLCDVRLQGTTLLASGINTWLGGGLPTGTITEIFGLPGTGKTWLASSLSANVSYNQGFKVVYITSSNNNVEKIVELIGKLKEEGKSDVRQSLQNIDITPVFDVYQLMEVLWSLLPNSYRLVILDSLASIFMPIWGDSSNDAISLLNKVASDLKRVAVVNRCAVLVINHEVKRILEEPIPALGRYWLSVPNLRLHSKRLNESQFELSMVRNVYCPDVVQKCLITLPHAKPTTMS